MKIADYGVMIVYYQLVISLLLMISSERIGVFAGYFAGRYKAGMTRLARISVLTVGACWTVVAGTALIAGFLLRL